MTVRHFLWQDVAPDSAFHAALGIRQGIDEGSIPLHDHDFCELFLVIDGHGEHLVNDTLQSLSSGFLTLIRPPDRHTLRNLTGERLYWVNVAFPLSMWRDYHKTAGLPHEWHRTALPPARLLSRERHARCEEIFYQALRRYRQAIDRPAAGLPSRLELCGFLSATLPFLLGETEPEVGLPLPLPATAPPWLMSCCRALAENADYLREGLPRLRQLSGRSDGHLTRALKQWTDSTPTEFINSLRLARAALLLTTTPLTIAEIAADCGFENLTYFYRLFGLRYHQPPNAYRQAAGATIDG